MEEAETDDRVKLTIAVAQSFDVLLVHLPRVPAFLQESARDLQHGIGVIGGSHLITLFGQVKTYPTRATGQVEDLVIARDELEDPVDQGHFSRLLSAGAILVRQRCRGVVFCPAAVVDTALHPASSLIMEPERDREISLLP